MSPSVPKALLKKFVLDYYRLPSNLKKLASPSARAGKAEIPKEGREQQQLNFRLDYAGHHL